MKTKIILLSIFQLFTIHILASSSSCPQKKTDDKQYHNTSFVFVANPNFAEKDKLANLMAQLSCAIPKNPVFKSNLLTGEKLDLDTYNQDVFKQLLSRSDPEFCNHLSHHRLRFVPQNSQIIVFLSKQDPCKFKEVFEEFKKRTDGNYRLNFVLLDDVPVDGYNAILININDIDPNQSLPSPLLLHDIESFIGRILLSMRNDFLADPRGIPTHVYNHHHHHHHHHDEDLEPWMIVVIVVLIVSLLISLIVGTLCIRNKLKEQKKEQEWKGLGSCSAEYELPKNKVKKLPKAPMPPSTASPSSYSGSLEVTKLSKEKSAKTKSTLSYSITLESVKSKKKKGGSKETVSKKGGSRETVSKKGGSKESVSKRSGSKESGSKEGGSKESGSRETVSPLVEKMEKTRMKTAEEPSKHKTSIITV